MNRGGRIGILLVAVATVAVSYTVATSPTGTITPPVPTPVDDRFDPQNQPEAQAVALRSFDDCGELLTYLRDEASSRVGAYGLLYGGVMVRAVAAAAEDALGAPQAAPAPGEGGTGGVDFSITNVQEAGVDEPDLIKTDGQAIFAVRGDTVFAVDVSGEKPAIAGSLKLEETYATQMLLSGDRLIVIAPNSYGIAYGGGPRVGIAESVAVPDEEAGGGTGSTGSGGSADDPVSDAPIEQWRDRTALHVIDVSDPGSMSIVKTLWVEGSYVSARMVGDIVRVVIRTAGPAIEPVFPTDGTERAVKEAEQKNREAIKTSTLEQWLPRYAVTDAAGEPADEGRSLAPCGTVRHPAEFSGVEMVTVMTVDPADPKPRNTETVVGTGEIVYASPTSLYVTSTNWQDQVVLRDGAQDEAPEITTQIHRFDITDPERARYVASGEVNGVLLNQWSMSEHEGNLRVVTTLGQWTGDSVTRVEVLGQQGPLLERIGRVGGLGKGEQVQAVRFIGDLGYVVTFRQVDPLYVVDLSDPADPRVAGELKIPGFSSYLHPVGDGLLLGVGQNATKEGQSLGVQASLFDVTDPSDPRRIATLELAANSYTEVQNNPLAFLWWEAKRLAVFPLSAWNGAGSYQGAVGLRVQTDAIARAGSIEHPLERPDPFGGPEGPEYFYDGSPQIERAVVIGDSLYTLSGVGLLQSDIDSFADQTWVPWTTK
ncbi:MAG TPA: beta-propeller domain-containing protein [Actinomycetota bacterium]